MGAPVVDDFTMRELVVAAGLGTMKDAQDMSRDDLEEIWQTQWASDRGLCRQAIRNVRLGHLGA